jgi:hypothetical protein
MDSFNPLTCQLAAKTAQTVTARVVSAVDPFTAVRLGHARPVTLLYRFLVLVSAVFACIRAPTSRAVRTQFGGVTTT